MPDATTDTAPCPRCRSSLTTLRTLSWCPQCEWNLAEYHPARHRPTFGWRRLDRWAHRSAYRANARQFAALSGRDLSTPGNLLARIATIGVSLALLTGVLTLAAGGILLVVNDFPGLALVPGALLILIAIVLRPRFGRLDPLVDRVTPEQAPGLFRLIGQVAEGAGTPGPHVVAFDRSLNAASGAVGPLRRRVLHIGLPLWTILPAQQRVALLAHELGHFANGDVRRGPLTQPAYLTLGTLAMLTRPTRRDIDRAPSLLLWISSYVAYAMLAAVSGAFLALQLMLLRLGRQDSHRAEYLADDRAATVAGSNATCGLLDSLVTLEAVAPMVARAARDSGEVASWRQAADESRRRLAGPLVALRQLSLSDGADLFATHPPAGLRHRMVATRPWRDPTVVLTEPAAEQIDAELSPLFKAARRSLGALA